MLTNRITIDIDGNFFVFVHSFIRCLILFSKVPRYRKTSKGYHLWIYLDRLITEKELYKYRLLLFDDRKRVKLDMRCRLKPKQVLFDEKKITEFDGKNVRVIKHQVFPCCVTTVKRTGE
ncbi:MAG TPA: hypothetical protein ENG45_00945 [Candidatus Aenigmarchaeota archaeon]|nr:hypothetical protein [Candidatus Aenigmarchaeota archaeon]